jgi:peptidoglycan/LPS O-acetylase OafA/YrhL
VAHDLRSDMQTIGDRLRVHDGVGPGFDFLRYSLAFSVVGWHSLPVAEGALADEAARATPLWFFRFAVVPLFFALSGFLITGSATRLTLGNFLINRGLRIVPALVVEVLLSAFILGFVFTKLPAADYFNDVQFWRYLLNIIGYVHLQLPGVFTDIPFPNVVNGSLWTIPFELGCYLVMSILILTGGIRHLWVVASCLGIFFVGSVLYKYTTLPNRLPYAAWRIMRFAFSNDGTFLSGPSLFPYFLSGSLFFLLRDRIPYDNRVLGVSTALLLTIPLAGNASWQDNTLVQAAASILLVYVLVFVGVSNLRPPSFLRYGDYSYGVYLYGFPIQQAIISVFPNTNYWYLNFSLTLIPLMMFATFSWHVVERPIVSLRKKYSFLIKRLESDPRIPGNR